MYKVGIVGRDLDRKEKSLMEVKRLAFDRPLLSVRRPASTQTWEPENKTRSHDSAPKMFSPPVFKSDIQSGPVRNPGTVPFQWEHKPGKPKDETKSDLQGLEQLHFVPKLPPGRTLNVRGQESGMKAETKGAAQTKHGNVASSGKYARKCENAIAEDARSSKSEYDDCDDEDGSQAFADAVDTLSRSESFFLNCRVSGVSGLDGPNLSPSGIFSSDPQAREFMMGRFLPAAKALASETPPHLTRKPPLQPRQIKKVVPKMKRHTIHRERSDFQHLMFQEQEMWEESGDEDEPVRHKSTVPGVCGLLPQICLKSSFGVLNPVPSVRMQARRAVSVRRPHSSYPSSIRCHQNENKHANGAQQEQRPTLKCLKAETQEDKVKFNTQPNRSECGTQKLNVSVPRGPPQDEALEASLISEGKENVENFRVSVKNSRAKTSKNFGELLASDDNRWDPCPETESPVAEKTLYVDTVHTVKSPKTDAEVQAEFKSPSPDFQVKDVQSSCDIDEKTTSQPESPEEKEDIKVDESPVQEFSECRSRNVNENQSSHNGNEETKEQCIQERPNEHEKVMIPLPGAAETGENKIDVEVQLQKNSNPPESNNGYRQLLPPPLPKAPSDSWLKRTLPTMSSKSSSTWTSSLGTDNFTKIQAFQISPADPKWETIVKTSNTRQGLVHLPKERLNAIPEA